MASPDFAPKRSVAAESIPFVSTLFDLNYSRMKNGRSESTLFSKNDEWLCECVCVLYLKVSQQTETGRWRAGTEQLLWLVCVPLSLWTHPEGLKTHTWSTCFQCVMSERAS